MSTFQALRAELERQAQDHVWDVKGNPQDRLNDTFLVSRDGRLLYKPVDAGTLGDMKVDQLAEWIIDEFNDHPPE